MLKPFPFLTKFAKEPPERTDGDRRYRTANPTVTPPPQTIETRVRPETTDDQ